MTDQLIIIQSIAAVFVLFAISRSYLRYKEGKLSSLAFVFWTLVWFGGVMAIIFPSVSSSVAKLLGIGRGVDAIIYGSIVVIFYLIFRIFIMIEDTKRQITDLARKVALRDSAKNEKPPFN